jgi:hypothetical protein
VTRATFSYAVRLGTMRPVDACLSRTVPFVCVARFDGADADGRAG